jgi:hypothetical protein
MYVINHHTWALSVLDTIFTTEGVDCHCEETPCKVGWMKWLRAG